MNTKHTPGPWEVGVDGDGKPGFVYCNNALGSAVAIVYGDALRYTAFSRAEEIANARLIAAAPDLYRELQHLARCLHPWIDVGHSAPGIATLNGAFAAIAKATGEQA